MEIILNRDTERYEVAKAGGWSLADSKRVWSVITYLQSNPEIHYFVPSAPGAVNSGDIKVTDRLIACYNNRESDESFEKDLKAVYQQFITVAQELGYTGIEKLLNPIEQGLKKGKGYDWVVSRGEAVNGQMLADILGWRFIDPTELIKFRKDGRLDERSYQVIRSRLKGRDRFVIPGFYGLGVDGEVWTFPRDGSDVSGAVISRGVNARIYRNLTSADGVLSADPNIVGKDKARPLQTMTYQEYRELGNGGFKVLHRDTIITVATAGIPINVRHSELPASVGTTISSNRPEMSGEDVIGIAGKKGFIRLRVYKLGMDEDKGIAARILRIIGRNDISFAHLPTENDSVSVVFTEDQLNEEKEERIMAEITKKIGPTELSIRKNMGVLSVVGQGVRQNGPQVVEKLATALNGVSIKHGITYTEPSVTIKVFVDSHRMPEAVREAHRALIEERNN